MTSFALADLIARARRCVMAPITACRDLYRQARTMVCFHVLVDRYRGVQPGRLEVAVGISVCTISSVVTEVAVAGRCSRCVDNGVIPVRLTAWPGCNQAGLISGDSMPVTRIVDQTSMTRLAVLVSGKLRLVMHCRLVILIVAVQTVSEVLHQIIGERDIVPG